MGVRKLEINMTVWNNKEMKKTQGHAEMILFWKIFVNVKCFFLNNLHDLKMV